MVATRVLAAALVFAAFSRVPLLAHDIPAMDVKGAAEMAQAAGEMSEAANSLLNALDDEQKKKISFDFKDAEREKFIFVPDLKRKGLTIKEMAPVQRPLALALLNTGLSQYGFNSVLSIMSLEGVLFEQEKGKKGTPVRDAENYFVEIFGKPGNDQIWGWRFEGHHFSASFTCVMGKTVIAAPLFMGCNPEVVKEGPRKGHATLKEVEDAGRKFIMALNDDQKKKAIIVADTPKDIYSATKRRIELKKEGIPASELNKDQKDLLLALIHEYLRRDRPEIAAAETARVEKEGIDTISFAWGGQTEVGKTHYYRIQSDTFMIEYDNFQNDGNHIHSVWRDLKNDYGEDVLKRHYEMEHKAN
ncbi:MAG TPA: DUF3500 domain-containing protein [Planctomycetota bacterium]|nr:DUF3500 domain-containing protein [Planctomycetota bacterium]